MSIRHTYKSAEHGGKLVSLQKRGQRAINTLNDLRTELPHLKSQIDADADFTAAEKTAAKAEVDAVIANLVQQIKDFAAGL